MLYKFLAAFDSLVIINGSYELGPLSYIYFFYMVKFKFRLSETLPFQVPWSIDAEKKEEKKRKKK